MLFSRQIIINFIRCALSRGGACARIFSRTTCSLARQILSDSGGEYADETKRFLLHFATQYRGWKLRPTKHFVLQYFHRPSFIARSLSLSLLFYLIFALIHPPTHSFSLTVSLAHSQTRSIVRLSHVSTLSYSFYDTFRNAFISRFDK